MKISQPFVLLLGGLLSASSIGCSVINAVVSDYRPGSQEGRGSAERMLAIGRVFENQGKYDQAEAMYRRAQKQKPADPAIREQLQQLAGRREGRKFDAKSAPSALAMAHGQSASGQASLSGRSSNSTRVKTNPPAAAARTSVQSDIAASARTERATVVELTSATDGQALTSHAGTGSSQVVSAVASSLPAATVVQAAAALPSGPSITADEILAVVDSPADYADLLLQGLTNGHDSETRCLAATLLGDCDPGDGRVGDALKHASETETDPRLLLAVADSRIQRHEADSSTADCLIQLIRQQTGETRTQALLDLRHFAGTESHDDCVTVIQSLLNHDEHSLKAISGLTLKEFTESSCSEND